MSSNSECVSPIPSRKVTIDSERLIAEVKKRPALWDKNDSEYTHRHLKLRQWTDISKILFASKWNSYTATQKRLKSLVMQRKWKNIKDTFLKDILIQRRISLGQTAKQKRRYIHSDALAFLTPVAPKSEPNDKEDDNYVTIMEEILDDPFDSEGNRSDQEFIVEKPIPISEKQNDYHHEIEIEKPAQNMVLEQDRLLQMLLNKERRYNDEDIAFAEMIVPLLRKLNDEQKHRAKLEILNVLHESKKYDL